MTPDIEKLIASLREMCVDFDGSQIVDGASPRYEPDCGILRQAADTLASLVRERDEAREALAFYAQQWVGGHDRFWEPSYQLLQDCGVKARKALRSLSSERREGP